MISKPTAQDVERVYLALTLLNTLAASFIWGINTIFLLDAGLTNAQAFLANAFFTLGQVLFEVPTGVVADVKGRRASYVLGTVTLAISTGIYLFAWMVHAPFMIWAISSVLLGLGFTFFSGATEAWLVDALEFVGENKGLEKVFGHGQIVGGIAMLVGATSGGVIAQATNLSVPYLLRIGFLLANCVVAVLFMKDWGFTPVKSTHVVKDIKTLLYTSVSLSLKLPALRWVILASPFTAGVGFYVFYAVQPHLLQLYGDPTAYAIAGVAASLVALAQIVGGIAVQYVRKLFRSRTSLLLTVGSLNVVLLIAIGVTQNFWIAVLLLAVWALIFALSQPVRQAYVNGLIPSKQRATVLSFDSMVGSSGGAVIQPGLGRIADIYGYGRSFIASGIVISLALPFIFFAKRTRSECDKLD